MRISDAARVGLTVLLAVVVLIAATFSIRGMAGRGGTYVQKVSFTDALGIQEGAYVRVRGVDMGTVEKITLGPQSEAILTLRIKDEYRLSPQDGIRIVANFVGFTPPFVEITPGGRKTPVTTTGDILPGEAAPGPDALLTEGEKLLRNLNQLTLQMTELSTGLNQVVQDPVLRKSFQRTATNFAGVSESGLRIARNMEVATARIDRLVAGFQGTTAGLNRTLAKTDAMIAALQGTAGETQSLMRDARGVVRQTGELMTSSKTVVEGAGGLVSDTRSALAEGRTQLKDLLTTLNSSLKQLDATLVDARGLLADPELRGNFRQTSTNLRDASENLKKITADVQGLTGDPKVQEDLRATLASLRSTVEEAGDLFQRVRGVLGGGGKAAKTLGERIQDVELDAAVRRGFDSHRTRLDFNATIPWSQKTFYRAGFYDFGEENKINVQLGQQLRPGLWGRYGIFASRVGVGLDFGNRQRPPVRLDLFGVDRPQLDLQGNIPVAPWLDLTLGVDDVFYDADPFLGLRYRRFGK